MLRKCQLYRMYFKEFKKCKGLEIIHWIRMTIQGIYT